MKKLLISSALAGILLTPSLFADHEKRTSEGSCSTMCSGKYDKNSDPSAHFKKLDLTQTQKQQIENIKKMYMPQEEMLYQKMRNNFRELQMFRAGNYDEKTINKLAEMEGQLVRQKIELNMKLRHELYNVLTEKQRLQLRATMKKHMMEERE